MKRALEIDGQDTIPILILHGFEIREINEPCSAGVVDEDVEPAKCFESLGNHMAAGDILRHIALGRFDCSPLSLAALMGYRFGVFGGLLVIDGHPTTGLRQLPCRCRPHTPRGAGDEGRFTVEVKKFVNQFHIDLP